MNNILYTQMGFSGVLMNRQWLYFSVISFTLSACSSVDNKRAEGNFDYATKQESRALIVPENLDKPEQKGEFLISNEINKQGPIGKDMDIRAPSLVLPIAASSRTEAESSDAIIWFDKVLEDQDLLVFIKNSLISQLASDEVSYNTLDISNDDLKGMSEVYESEWYHSEVETGWLFSNIEVSTSMRFRYELFLKPHGRSVSLKVALIDYMKTNEQGGSKEIDPIDKLRAEMAMLNEIVGQVDYNYRLKLRENRLMRANQKLVTIGENKESENAYVVEMGLDNLWDNMPIFFEKYGFIVNDLNETNKIYYVDFTKPDTSIWDSIWGDEIPVIDVADAKYKFVLATLDDEAQKTSVSIYNSDGQPLSLATLERIFPVMEAGLSFKNIY